MKAFLASIVVMIAIMFGADMVLDRTGFSSAEQASAGSVRLGD